MHIVHTTCLACAAHRPAAMVATLGDGRELALCHDCSRELAHRWAFALTFRGACHPACLTAFAARLPRALPPDSVPPVAA
ncbi:MAG: hypothetical protein AVDCRST_MAG13-3882 [uncultured Solirubrobacteraceae bacterium]|uniref:Uncharacterized protein n=1 Tax=uncultured Solirubrobacteraceae bacterium TaxID=1162706 RepID=A0A6J4TN45_9ACTN|nr:MAG: hypothetical protein AVDCRST_MAG13-3882 [uncultured Solirubrobacteraceae bacterium]